MVTPYVMRRNGKEPYDVPLPELDDILRPTYGVMLFQEQLMQIASRLSGMTFAEANLLRRAMTGGQRAGGTGRIRGLAHCFIERAIERGVPTVVHGGAQLRSILLAGAYLLLKDPLASEGQQIPPLKVRILVLL